MLLPLFRPPLNTTLTQEASSASVMGASLTDVYNISITVLVAGTYGPFQSRELLSYDLTMHRLDGAFMDFDIQGSPDGVGSWASLKIIHFEPSTNFASGSGQFRSPWLRFVITFDAATAFANVSLRLTTKA